ncbi:hypothetical protein CN978_25050 [Priestia megaterium]|uniref:hypothetical protein n=1 Tax=Priestia megaterium TaxID=1404 RepID=UPI000BFBC439|nr:hypothetical protein [Priestia megaterium]PGN62201.1 hypothetical protein CN978_25050 [Priestia megaterium]
MKNRYLISEVFFHKDVPTDIIEIAKTMTSEQAVKDFLQGYEKGLLAAMKNPFPPGRDLDFELEGWCGKEFFSSPRPAPGSKADYRLLHRYESMKEEFYKLAVGLRNAKGVNGESVYLKGKQRLSVPIDWKKE